MRWLVTGGAGFIGSHVVAGLLRRGQDVRVLDDLSTGRREKLGSLLDNVELVHGDARDSATARRACAGIDVVLHHAPGIRTILEAARDVGVRRVVFASSCAVYGNDARLPCSEDAPPDPRTPYAVEKATGEDWCRLFSERDGLETVVLRYFNVFGPRQDANSQYDAVVPRFVNVVLAGRPPVIHGDGRQSRDFTPVENVARANFAAGTVPVKGHLVCNVGTGEHHTLRALVRAIGFAAGRQVEPLFDPARPVGLRHSVASVERLRERLGLTEIARFAEGLALMVEWCRLQPAGAVA